MIESPRIPRSSRLLEQWKVLETRDPERARSHLSRLFRPHHVRLPRSTDAIRFRHDRVELGALSINALRYGEQVTIDATSNLADSYLVKFTLGGSSEVTQRHNRYRTRPGTVCVLNPSLPLNDRMSADFEMLIVQIEGRELRGLLAEQLGITLHRPLEFSPVCCPLSGGVASFARLVRIACEDLADRRSDLRRDDIGRELGRLMMHLLLLELPHSYSARLRQEGGRPAPRHLRRAEEYIHEHLDQPLTLARIAAVAGVSPRSLQLAFRKYLGTTPTRYIRDARLELARRSLSDPADDRSVSQVALDCGFTHLSRFARAYRQRYGEVPSGTRRRRRP